jgi:hypothetical protein
MPLPKPQQPSPFIPELTPTHALRIYQDSFPWMSAEDYYSVNPEEARYTSSEAIGITLKALNIGRPSPRSVRVEAASEQYGTASLFVRALLLH